MVVLICGFLMISDVQQLLAVYKSSLGKCLFRSSAHLLTRCLFLLLSCMSSKYLRYQPLIRSTCFFSSPLLLQQKHTHTTLFLMINKQQFHFLFCCFFFFRATHMAYGSSQAGLNQSYSCWPKPQPWQCQILSRVFDLHHSSQQHWILNTLTKARD